MTKRGEAAVTVRAQFAQFALAFVTTDATRCNHALVGLDEGTIGLVANVLEDRTQIRLKEQLIGWLSVSE